MDDGVLLVGQEVQSILSVACKFKHHLWNTEIERPLWNPALKHFTS